MFQLESDPAALQRESYTFSCCWVAGPGAETAGGACGVPSDGLGGDSRLPFYGAPF